MNMCQRILYIVCMLEQSSGNDHGHLSSFPSLFSPHTPSSQNDHLRFYRHYCYFVVPSAFHVDLALFLSQEFIRHLVFFKTLPRMFSVFFYSIIVHVCFPRFRRKHFIWSLLVSQVPFPATSYFNEFFRFCFLCYDQSSIFSCEELLESKSLIFEWTVPSLFSSFTFHCIFVIGRFYLCFHLV